ncbi:unnamed protein product [Clavelina lepadiformis]|uniref:Uncharacterized protein n=1 Tax=Clavelina lepadiformis TaxID=159417 RepID=A0ABP0FFQ6_CLALP
MGINIYVARHEKQSAVRNSHRQQSDEPWSDTKSKALAGTVTGRKVSSRQVVHRTERDMRTRMIPTMTSLTTGVRSTTALLVHTVERHEKQSAVWNSHRQQSDEPSGCPSD